MHFHQWKRREFMRRLGGTAAMLVGGTRTVLAEQAGRRRRIGV
jgi:hypothetical protein